MIKFFRQIRNKLLTENNFSNPASPALRFILLKVRVIFKEEGAIVFGPANVPHPYKNLGPGRLDSLDVHLNGEWIQYDLAREGEKLSAPELT